MKTWIIIIGALALACLLITLLKMFRSGRNKTSDGTPPDDMYPLW